LEKLGVEVILGEPVTLIEPNALTFGERRVEAHTIIWAAGVRASPAADWLGVPADRNGRIVVEPDLSIPGYADIFAVGDTAAVRASDGSPVPGIAPAAKQEGAFVAKTIRQRIAGVSEQRPFHYHHEGSLAQIGKRKAVIDFGWIRLRGAIAWWLCGIALFFFLVGVGSRLCVALYWLWI
jgi:NADH dehydrogenase